VNLRSHPYESYRASNSEWVDQTPSEWEEKRVKDLFRLVTDKAPVDNDHELLSLYASIGVRPRKDLEARGNKASSTDGYWLVKKGDIVVNKLLAWMGSVGLSEYDGVTSPAYDVLRKTSKLVDVRYFSYLFRTEIAKQIFKRNSRGIMDMRLRLYFDKLGAITVPVPPFSAQRAIATYIDTKTTQIDRQIDLLSQKATQYGKLKQSLIVETVTRGLDKSVPMKDSGVEWVGDEMPAHWEVKRVKEVGLVVLGKMLDNVKSENTRLRSYLKSKNIGWLKVEDTDIEQMYFSAADMKSYRLKRGDILLSEGGEVGKTAFWNDEIEECYIQNSVHKITVYKNNCARFFLYQSFLLGSIKYYDSIVSHVSIKHLTKEKLSRVSWVRPPIVEQVAIAAYLDDKIAQIDRIVAAINSQIDKLKILRKALINDAVTGKIKVA
jgi:type I restriction enzyme S subunit